MADMNKFNITGTIPYFEDPARRMVIFNEGDEKRVHAIVKLNVQSMQKDDTGRYKSETFEVTVWGKKVEALKKFNVKGKGLWFEGRLTPPRKKDDGTWTGIGLTAYDFGTLRTVDDRNESSSSAPAAMPGVPAPAAPQGGIVNNGAPAPATPAAATGTDDEDWPF